jgi:acyl carrier protein
MSIERTKVEPIVADVWRDLLKTTTVNANDNFLDQGGTSLKAGQLSARILEAFGVELSIDVILDADSFEALCQTINANLATTPADGAGSAHD